MSEQLINADNSPLPSPTPGQTFAQGALISLPLIIAAIPFAIVYGALGEALQLSFWIVIALSMFVFAGASQFIALNLMAIGAQFPIIVFTVFLVNLRHTLYAMTLTPFLKTQSVWQKVAMAFSLTDETFAVVVNRATQNKQHLGWFYAGSSLLMYINWIFWSAMGFAVGAQFPKLQHFGLDVAMVVAFTGIVVASLKTSSHWYCMIAAAIAAVLTYHWPYQLGLLFSAFFAIAVGVFSERSSKKTNSQLQEEQV
ncbi:AzlC family ABC transporter permease [Planctobacterium marinum]|uniref:AzlC family ABC transporter permease n=1 Tax=Planctobacterium marinum TaxID=1631968 RepID=UPI001E33BC76|nr:AzlC family ABC transporter permease [Planctobacterium marinum]MCC2607466.1 AzlC family ABC transporter permease [Planctobacterium marinum]